ncbi:MAG: ATP synthase F1 subunit delta [Eubacteriales bacterium]|nr:ATP synthase F1 subunit delta [Eubacteriales bacterium]MDD3199149.1 ATP synthase F1 subunit delta [Eubacteriales bacterium]MDD4121538.1 ATP synthase F1 subunit delta [Eubacteriales bacterium]MDD4629196.1 ATP synthase F1 subunit delta [Eubacteriales bacterium]
MAELTVEITYGKALFEAARDRNKVDVILEELNDISEIFNKNPDFKEFFCSPVISEHEKSKVIEQVFGGSINQETINFLLVLIDKRRMTSFQRIVKEYQKLINQENGISLGTVFSVEPLTDIQLSSFEEKTAKLLHKKVKLVNKTDAYLLGGIKIFIEGKVIDASIRKQLQNLEGSIKQT